MRWIAVAPVAADVTLIPVEGQEHVAEVVVNRHEMGAAGLVRLHTFTLPEGEVVVRETSTPNMHCVPGCPDVAVIESLPAGIVADRPEIRLYLWAGS